MKLNSVEFYQSVRLWDNQEYKTVVEGKNRQLEAIELDLRDHIVTIYCPGKERLILVPTANMRMAMVEYFGERNSPEHKALIEEFIEAAQPDIMEVAERLTEVNIPVAEEPTKESKYEAMKPKAPPKRIKGQG